MQRATKNLRYVQGRVLSDKMDKTRVLKIEFAWKHPLLRKNLLYSRRLKIHDEHNQSAIGDLVKAVEVRPLSRHKRHRLVEILEKAK